MRIIQHILLLFMLCIELASCQTKENKNMVERFEWVESTNAPLGYPAEVYRGGLELAGGGYVGLYNGMISGRNGWGNQGGGTSRGMKSLPNRLNVIYLSYAENQFYHVDCAIDYDKLVEVFKRPLYFRGASGDLLPLNFNKVMVGFVPGGVVVVWASAPGTVVEIGRYQGEKTTVPQSEIDALDVSASLIFDSTHVARIMHLESVIPKKVQEANKNKPIPFGVWDEYRVKYHWQPIFQIQNEGRMGDYGFSYFNGEMDDYYYEDNKQSQRDSELFYQDQESSLRLAIPKEISFSWFDNTNQKYVGYFRFNETEIMEAFAYLSGDDLDTQIEMVVRPTIANTYATILLRASNGREVALSSHDDQNFFKVRVRR